MIAPSVIAEIAARLDATSWRGRGLLIASEAERLCVSRNTLYAQLRAFRGRTRRARADRGAYRRLDAAAVRAIAQIKAKAHDRDKGRTLPTEVAIKTAIVNGMAQAGAITRASFDRIAKRERLLGAPRTYCRYESSRSNYLHHVDASQSKYFRVLGRREDGEWVIVPRLSKYTRKRSEEPLGLWLVGVIDDCSRTQFISYCVAAGESWRMMAEGLARAWSNDPLCQLRGMPERLMCDFGPLRSSQAGQNLCDQLGVVFEDRMPNSPHVSGKVERPWRTLWQSFELAFTLNPSAQYTVREANGMLCSWVASRNAREHPTHLKRSRLALYAERLDPGAVRYIPENWQQAITHEDYRVVDASARVRYGNTWYAVPDALTGATVRILTNAQGDLICERDGQTWPMTAFRAIETGEYRAHKDTPAMRMTKESADLTIAVIPHALAGQLPTLHRGEAGTLSTPFEERSYLNREQARLAFCTMVGKGWHEFDGQVRDLVDRLLEHPEMLDKEKLMALALEVRAMGQGA